MKKLGIFFAVLIVGMGLQRLGAWANHVVMNANKQVLVHNNGCSIAFVEVPLMPVLGMSYDELDGRHIPLTKKSRWIILADIIPIPDSWGAYAGFDLASIGDISIDVGQFVLAFLFILPEYWFIAFAWRQLKYRRKKCPNPIFFA